MLTCPCPLAIPILGMNILTISKLHVFPRLDAGVVDLMQLKVAPGLVGVAGLELANANAQAITDVIRHLMVILNLAVVNAAATSGLWPDVAAAAGSIDLNVIGVSLHP